MTELRSLSKFGLSQVNLIFEDGTDIYRVRQLVSERLQTVLDSLPPGLTPRDARSHRTGGCGRVAQR